MEVKVQFRFNKVTGQMEFIVDDVDSRLPEAEHNREHERIATEIGRVIAQNPGLERLEELGPPDGPPVINAPRKGTGTDPPEDQAEQTAQGTTLTGGS